MLNLVGLNGGIELSDCAGELLWIAQSFVNELVCQSLNSIRCDFVDNVVRIFLFAKVLNCLRVPDLECNSARLL